MSARVAILGAGAAAFALAVHLAGRGHAPVLWSPSGRRIAQGGRIAATGIVEGGFPVEVAATCAEALSGARAAVVALPATGHRAVLDAAAAHLAPGQAVVISSHASFGALHLDRLLGARGLRLPIVAWSTTLLRARQPDPDSVRIATLRKRVDMAVLPVAMQDEGARLCQELFGDHFNLRSDLLAVSLSNVNPQSHAALSLCNFTRMELGEAWDQNQCSTEGVARLNRALDAERMEIARRFGVTVRSLDEHRTQTHGAAPAAAPVRTLGPATVETRYTLEDVPYGLVPMVALARIAGTPAPLHETGIRLFSILYGRDLAAGNGLLDGLGLDGMTAARFHALCREGHAARPQGGSG